MNKNRPIGVFDSGIGGLTVLNALIKILPNEDYIYIADHLHCPYGIKSYQEIKSYCIRICNYFLNRKVKAIVIACNTASIIKEELIKLIDIPIISVIEPTALKAIEKTNNKRIGLLGTKFTIDSNKYQNILVKNKTNVFPVICDEFVKIVESGYCGESDINIVKLKLNKLIDKDIDTVILGCTHFELLQKHISDILGDKIYISCGEPTAVLLKSILEEMDLMSETKKNKMEFYSTNLNKINPNTLDFFEFSKIEFNEIII